MEQFGRHFLGEWKKVFEEKINFSVGKAALMRILGFEEERKSLILNKCDQKPSKNLKKWNEA